jgi:hypothetical protein
MALLMLMQHVRARMIHQLHQQTLVDNRTRHLGAIAHVSSAGAHSASLEGAAGHQRRVQGGVQKLAEPTLTSAGTERSYTVRRRITLNAPYLFG